MSDCSTNANGPYDVARLRIEFEGEEIPWMYPLALNGRSIQGVYVDGEQHEFGADSLIQMLEDYEDAQGMSNHMKLFGTPERAARTVFGIVYSEAQGCDDNCPLSEFCNAHVDEEPPDDEGESALLEWLRGKGE